MKSSTVTILAVGGAAALFVYLRKRPAVKPTASARSAPALDARGAIQMIPDAIKALSGLFSTPTTTSTGTSTPPDTTLDSTSDRGSIMDGGTDAFGLGSLTM